MLDFNALPEWLIQAGEEEEEEEGAVVKTGGLCWRRQVTAPQGRRRLSNQPSVFDFELQMSGIVVNESKSDGGAEETEQLQPPSQPSTQQDMASLPQGSTGHTYAVVFQDGPLGMGLKEGEFGSATVQVVVDGGQAARGGVKVNDLVAAVDTETMTYAEVMAEMTNKQRPFTMSFFRPPPSSGSAKSVQL